MNMSTPADPDWHLQEWAKENGKIQADLVSELGMHKNAAHRIWHGRQPYRRDIVNLIAAWLGIRPYELLMPPQEAIALRGLRESAALITAQFEGQHNRQDELELAAPRTRQRTR